MKKMNDYNLNIRMSSKQLPIYKFDNGSKVCNASLYNFYEVLKLLGFLKREDKSYESMCWVRDYELGYTIKTAEQLENLLLNGKSRLRISFFSERIDSINDLIIFAKNRQLPIVDENPHSYSSSVRDKILYVYTLWFYVHSNYIKPCLSRSNIINVDTLFEKIYNSYKVLLRSSDFKVEPSDFEAEPYDFEADSYDFEAEPRHVKAKLSDFETNLKQTFDGTTQIMFLL
jgi:hypothetical protein